jgi:replicative DNA helicase
MASDARKINPSSCRPNRRSSSTTGSIEQDADVVAFIHREGYYKKDENGEDPDTKNKAEIIVAKQRNGPTGSVHLAYFAEYTRFENLAYGAGPDGY